MESPKQRKIGALLFPGFELLDVFGPLELFGMLPEFYAIVMLGTMTGPISSNQGPAAVAEMELKDAAALDLLLVPGGFGTRRLVKDSVLIKQLQLTARVTPAVASVCTGSAILATAGVLDNRRATTNKLAFDWATAQGPSVHWERKARWVEDGKFWTSSGVSAGMDMALAIIASQNGRENALKAARQAEYLWNENSEQDPFSNLIPSE